MIQSSRLLRKTRPRLLVRFFSYGAIALVSCQFGLGLALAADGHSDSLPSNLWYQVLNFTLFVGLLYWFTKDPIKKYFVNHRKEYLIKLEDAEGQLNSAQQSYESIKLRLEQLVLSEQETRLKAHGDASAVSAQLLSEAELTANKILEEAEQSAKFEYNRLRFKLFQEIIDASIEQAHDHLPQVVGEVEDLRLRKQFIEHLRSVPS